MRKKLKRDRTKTITIHHLRPDENQKLHKAIAHKLMGQFDEQLEDISRVTLDQKDTQGRYMFDELRVQEYCIEILADELHDMLTTLDGPIPPETIDVRVEV
jgi:hypothetical protein